MSKTTIIVPKPKKPECVSLVYFIALIFVYVWAFSGVPLEGIKDTAGEITKAIMTGVLNPDWAYVSLPDGEDLLHGLIDTLAIAILGTFISAFYLFHLLLGGDEYEQWKTNFRNWEICT